MEKEYISEGSREVFVRVGRIPNGVFGLCRTQQWKAETKSAVPEDYILEHRLKKHPPQKRIRKARASPSSEKEILEEIKKNQGVQISITITRPSLSFPV